MSPFRTRHLYRLQLASRLAIRALFPKLRCTQARLLLILPPLEKQRRLLIPLHRLNPPLLPPQILVVPVVFVISRVGIRRDSIPIPTPPISRHTFPPVPPRYRTSTNFYQLAGKLTSFKNVEQLNMNTTSKSPRRPTHCHRRPKTQT